MEDAKEGLFKQVHGWLNIIRVINLWTPPWSMLTNVYNYTCGWTHLLLSLSRRRFLAYIEVGVAMLWISRYLV